MSEKVFCTDMGASALRDCADVQAREEGEMSIPTKGKIRGLVAAKFGEQDAPREGQGQIDLEVIRQQMEILREMKAPAEAIRIAEKALGGLAAPASSGAGFPAGTVDMDRLRDFVASSGAGTEGPITDTPDEVIDCPACGESVRLVASATLSLSSLRALSQAWRRDAKEEAIDRDPGWPGAEAKLYSCADDLDAALDTLEGKG